MKKKNKHGGRREGSGRPKLYIDTIKRTFKLPKELYDQIQTIADETETSWSATVVRILTRAIGNELKKVKLLKKLSRSK